MSTDDIYDNLKKYYGSLNIFTGFMMGMGLRYALTQDKINIAEVVCSILNPGFYCGLMFFNILHTGRLLL